MSNKKFVLDPKIRFSSRVENYIKYRPNYPQEIIEFLTEKRMLTERSVVADIGSGTGILSEIFLKNGNIVYGIEPNIDMRKAGEKLLEKYARFFSVDGSAELTGLGKKSIDLITAGQAFHWFDIERTKLEFKRILKPNGYVVLIWNNRKKKGDNFSNLYENLVSQYGIDYKEVRKEEGNVNKFYKEMDLEGFKGRFLSASYIPLENDPIFPEMISKLEEIYFKFEQNGTIKLEYDTEVYYGQLE
jgi:SAM-dependent methyltransferase